MPYVLEVCLCYLIVRLRSERGRAISLATAFSILLLTLSGPVALFGLSNLSNASTSDGAHDILDAVF